MKIKIFSLTAVAAIALAGAGCVNTVDGHQHFGVPFVKNEVEGRYERSVPQILAAARAVIKFNGALIGDNTVNNSLEGRVDEEAVYIQVQEVDPLKPVSRVVVQVLTRAGGGDSDLAHELEKQIALKLQAGN
jgi:hypothetical protein